MVEVLLALYHLGRESDSNLTVLMFDLMKWQYEGGTLLAACARDPEVMKVRIKELCNEGLVHLVSAASEDVDMVQYRLALAGKKIVQEVQEHRLARSG